MPDWKAILRQQLAALALPPALEEEIREELASDLEERYQRELRAGRSEAEAERIALEELRSPAELAEEIRAAQLPVAAPEEPAGIDLREGGVTFMIHDLIQDIRYGARMLARTPLFTVVAVVSLGLGIGANTAIFSLVNQLLLNPLPLKDAGALVAQFTTDTKNTARFQSLMQTSYPNFQDYREQNKVFAGMAAHVFTPFSLTTGGQPEQVLGELVTGNYFDVLGVRPAAGQFFSYSAEEDKKLGAYPVVVLGHALWKRRFGGDLRLIGQSIQVNRQSFTVVGVAPENFRGVTALGGAQMWVPISMYAQVTQGFLREFVPDRRALLMSISARLKPGVRVSEAEAALKIIGQNLAASFPKENDSRAPALRPIIDATFFNPELRRDVVSAGSSLMAIVGIVLLIACANVANLLLARAAGRQREVVVRISLGASRGRLIRQLLTESLLLAGFSGALGLLFAFWGQELLWSIRPAFLQDDPMRLNFDGGVLLFTSVVTLLTGVLFGLAPALQISRPNLAAALKDRSAQPRGNRGWWSLRNALVAAQVALSLVALVGAGLFLRSLQAAQIVDPGFEPREMMVLSFDPGAQRYSDENTLNYYRQALERVRTLPMVQSAALAQSPPFAGGFARTVFPEGMDMNDRRNGKLTQLNQVWPGYFQATGMSLLRGRDFTEADHPGTPMVAVINETMASTMWPGQDPIGRRFRCFGETWAVEIIGIVRDAKYITLGEAPTPFFYFSMLQHQTPAATLHVRTQGDPAAALGTVRSTVQALDPLMPLVAVSPMQEVMDAALWAPRMTARLLTLFALLALALAALGIHGVVSYSVSQRTQEIGIRIALGATPANVVAMMLRGAMAVVGLGAAFGMALAYAGSHGLAGLLIGTETADPVTYLGTALVLMAAAFIASYLPARRAAQIDPLLAVRHE